MLRHTAPKTYPSTDEATNKLQSSITRPMTDPNSMESLETYGQVKQKKVRTLSLAPFTVITEAHLLDSLLTRISLFLKASAEL